MILNLSLSLSLLAVFVSACARDAPPHDVLVFNHGKLAGDPSMMRRMLDVFERDHPGVQVREEVLPASTDQQHQYYAINLDSRDVPFDLFAIDVIWAQEFARAGWIVDVDAVIGGDERESYFPSTLEAATYERRLYAIPWYVDVGLLYYRKDLLDRYGFAPPTTWTRLVAMSRTILRGEANPRLYGFLWTGKQYEGLVCVALEFIWGRGGSLLSPTHADMEALAFMRDLIERDGISPPSVAVADEESVRLLFADGRAIFMRNWPYAWALFDEPGSPLRGKVGMAALPAFDGHRSASVLGGWMLAVPRHARHRETALQLLRYLAGRDVQHGMAQIAGYHPARRDLYRDPDLKRAQPWLEELYPVFEAARPRPPSPYYLMLSQVWQPELSAAIVDRKSPADALASARRQMDRIVTMEGQQDAVGSDARRAAR